MYGDGNTTVVIARISTIFWDNYDESWGIFENPHFNSDSIFDEFCILGRMSHMMPLMKHALSLQNGLYRRGFFWTGILPTMFCLFFGLDLSAGGPSCVFFLFGGWGGSSASHDVAVMFPFRTLSD